MIIPSNNKVLKNKKLLGYNGIQPIFYLTNVVFFENINPNLIKNIKIKIKILES